VPFAAEAIGGALYSLLYEAMISAILGPHRGAGLEVDF
jgi:hypothetical protein